MSNVSDLIGGAADEGPAARIRALYGEGRFAEAVATIRDALKNKPDLGDEWRLIANAANTLSDRYAAKEAALHWRATKPEVVETQIYYADQLALAGNIDDAIAAAKSMCEAFPDIAHAWFTLGSLEAQTGDVRDAAQHLRKAWEIEKEFTAAWERITQIKNFRAGDPDVPIIFDLPKEAAKLGPNFQISAHYAAANVLDQLGQPHRAFPQFEAAARLVRETTPYDMGNQLAVIKNGMDAFNEERLAELAGAGDPSTAPVFVIGPPRSGTTLVEQILASHSRVTAAGETSALRLATWPLKTFTPDDVAMFAGGGDNGQWKKIGSDYLNNLRELFGEYDVITNKDIGSIASIGLIRVVLPNAKFIFCDRDPMDVGWSCFKAHFSSSLPWTFDFKDIAQYLAAFRFARNEWRKRLGDGFLDVRYEELAQDPENQISRILEFCDLPSEPDCFAFYKTRRQISTASIIQARRPMYTTSIGRWRPYDEFLGPLKDAMTRYGLEWA